MLGFSGVYLSDYLNPMYVHEAKTVDYSTKKNVVLYNPKKGYSYTQKLMEACADLRWVPLDSLGLTQMIETMKTSKLYIDFGPHPGKDRLPREAAIMGC